MASAVGFATATKHAGTASAPQLVLGSRVDEFHAASSENPKWAPGSTSTHCTRVQRRPRNRGHCLGGGQLSAFVKRMRKLLGP